MKIKKEIKILMGLILTSIYQSGGTKSTISDANFILYVEKIPGPSIWISGN